MFGLESLLKVVAPHDCLVCGAEGALLCERCQKSSIQFAELRCFRCQGAVEESFICGKCRTDTGLTSVWIAANYDGVLKELIKRYKFDRAQDVARQLAKLLEIALPVIPSEFCISYVPTATSRVRERGYDHAKLIAKRYAKSQGRKMLHLLARSGQARQVGASRWQRLEQLESAFRVRNVSRVRGRDILLIDDVVTTGATLMVATKILIKAGVRSVSALVVAQKQ